MIEWFDSIWSWIVNNYEAIIGFLTSTTFLGVVGAVFTVVKNSKTVKNNSKIITDVQAAFSDTSVINTNVALALTCIQKLPDLIKVLDEKLSQFDKISSINNEDLQTKIDSMLEVQRIVYSTIKDDNIRNSVNSILTNAKNAEAMSKGELVKEINELKKIISDNAEALNNAVNKVQVAEATDVKVEEATPNTTLTRY